jgi:hypothetical protein
MVGLPLRDHRDTNGKATTRPGRHHEGTDPEPALGSDLEDAGLDVRRTRTAEEVAAASVVDTLAAIAEAHLVGRRPEELVPLDVDHLLRGVGHDPLGLGESPDDHRLATVP